MSIKSRLQVIKLPNGVIYIAGPPEYVGALPAPLDVRDPEMQEIFEAIEAVLRAGDEKN